MLTLLTACDATNKAPKAPVDNKTLNQQLEEMKPTEALDISTVSGATETEKLLYLLDIPTTTKSGILIFMDAQIKNFETVGNKELAAELRQNRALMSRAADETIDVLVAESAAVYDEVFTPEEISELIKVFSQPVMKKYVSSTIELQQLVLPVAEKWGADHFEPRYNELLKEQGGH